MREFYLPDDQYRALPGWSNSGLGMLAARLFNKPPFSCSQATLDFGTAFHTITLEPQNKIEVLKALKIGNVAIFHLYHMQDAVMNCTDLRMLLQNAKKEIVRTWIDEETGLSCKGKIDAIPTDRHLLDLKTTSCKSLLDFKDSINTYDYDRQAAFYLSSDYPTAEYFEFVGVQKQPPYALYRVPLHRDSEVVERGRQKMRLLMKLAKEQTQKV